MSSFYYNAMAVTGNRDDIDRFLNDVGIPKDFIGQNEGTDVDEFGGENRRLNDERYARFIKTITEVVGINVDRVRTYYESNSIWVHFDSHGWHGGPIGITFGPKYPHLKFWIHFLNDGYITQILRVHGAMWDAWLWMHRQGDVDTDEYAFVGHGAVDCYDDYVFWRRKGKPVAEFPDVSGDVPPPGMELYDTDDFFGELFEDDVPRTAIPPG